MFKSVFQEGQLGAELSIGEHDAHVNGMMNMKAFNTYDEVKRYHRPKDQGKRLKPSKDLKEENKRILLKMKDIALNPQQLHPETITTSRSERQFWPGASFAREAKPLAVIQENKKLVKRILEAKPMIQNNRYERDFKRSRSYEKAISKRNKDHYVIARGYSPKSKTKMYTEKVRTT